MLTLYAIPPSLYCAKVRIVLRAKGLDWRELPPPGGYGSAEYRRLVPSGNLPALLHDGLLLADSEAIAEYLNERFPDPPLMPAGLPERARMRERGRFHDTRLEPELRRLFPHIAPAARDAGVVAAQAGALQARLDQLGHLLERDDLPFGLGDCGLPVTLAWLDALGPVLGLSLALPAPVQAWRARVEAEPPVAAELAGYRPVLDAWLAKATA
ncbi:MAG: glutathione S-transferase family protein [Paracoccaceae bacterium]